MLAEHVGSAECLSRLYNSGGDRGVEPRGLPISFAYTQIKPNNEVTRGTHMIGPRVLTPFTSYRTHVTPRFDNHQPTKTYHVTTVRLYGLYGPATSDCTDYTDWYSQHLLFFDLFGLVVTDHDIFSIRSPFDESKYTARIRKTRWTQWHCFRLHSEHFEI